MEVINERYSARFSLGPLLFNIFINDIFFLANDTEVCNYADDTTIFACDSDVNNVQYKLEADASLFSKWFVDNHMKLNDAKCHFMLFGTKSSSTSHRHILYYRTI